MMEEALEAYKKRNGIYPERIVYYRDGVGDMQKKTIYEQEILQMQAAFAAKGIDFQCIALMVNKRVSTKFFLDQGNNVGNVIPGTMVDRAVSRLGTYDFYLVSQRTRQGVATPTHYTVIYDNVQAKPELIQMLTFKLCYTYYNVSGAIRIPAPVQYAHRLSNLIGERFNAQGNNMPREHLSIWQIIKKKTMQ